MIASRVRLASRVLIAAGALSSLTSVRAATPRMVDCDTVVPSHKRGLCANDLSADDFKAIAPGVSWWYNWDHAPSQTPPEGVKIEFLPMVWGDRAADLSGLRTYLATHKPHAILAINEPNLKGQAFIPPQETAELFKKVLAIGKENGIEVVGPQMALGSAPDASISADDPVQHKRVTYGWMGSFLDAFFFYCDKSLVPAFSVHSYKDMGELNWAVESMHKTYSKPIWVTEFAQWGARDAAAERRYMIHAVDFLENAPYVPGYAWFKERVKDNQKLSILGDSGELTDLGKTYVNLPSHEANVFYKIPGTLDAGKYTTMQNVVLDAGDTPDKFVVVADQNKASLDYQVAPAAAGVWTVAVHVKGKAAPLSVGVKGATEAGTGTPTGKDWETVSLHVKLAAGPQTLHLQLGGRDQTIDTITFSHE